MALFRLSIRSGEQCYQRFLRVISNGHREPLISNKYCTPTEKLEIPPGIFLENKSAGYPGAEEVKGHWHWVERLLPPTVVPEPPKYESDVAPSGWKAPPEKAPDLPYFVGRTRNHMLPVYKLEELRGPRILTVVKRVEGNIWELEHELRTYLEKKHQKSILSQVHEVVGLLRFKGNYVDDVKEWLLSKGF